MKLYKTIFMLSVVLMAGMLLWYAPTRKTGIAVPESTHFPQAVELGNSRTEHTGYMNILHFESNKGQTNAGARFISRGNGYMLYLAPTEAILALRGGEGNDREPDERNYRKEDPAVPQRSYYMLRMKLEGANKDPRIVGCNELPGKSNYFLGNDPADWITDIPHYARVEYQAVYPGIDLAYYGNERQLEYDFIISPAGDPRDILLKFDAPEKPSIDCQGGLVLARDGVELTMKPPVAYQEIGGVRNPVFSAYALRGDQLVGFDIGDYDPEFPLVIDPVLVYASYLGTNGGEGGQAIAVDDAGCAYVTGFTSSPDFPTLSCVQCDLYTGSSSSLTDVYVTKFNAEGTGIVYSTYLGGNWSDYGEAIAVDANGRVCITGSTNSLDNTGTPENEGFPLMNAYQLNKGDNSKSDAFVAVLNASGNALIYSSYLGGKGEDYGTGIAVDESGFVYVTGTEFAFDFPVKNAFMEDKPSYYFDAFVSKINPYASGEASLVYSTHLGGNFDDYGNSIAVDREGCAYVTGKAFSTDFPLTEGAIQNERKGSSDVFVTKLATNGRTLEYSTYLGSVESDEGLDIAVDTAGYAYVSGYGRNGFPTTSGAYIPAGGYFFLCKILPDGSNFAYSTHTPVTGRIAVDDAGQVCIGAYFNTQGYIVTFNASGSDTLYTLKFTGNGSNYIRDIAVDAERSVYIVGHTTSTDVATEGAYQTDLKGSLDVWVAKFGRPNDELVVEVLDNPLFSMDTPIPNVSFDIYSVDLGNKADPFKFLENQTTDDKGLLHLPVDYYHPGMAFLIRTTPEKASSLKSNRGDLYMCAWHIDNLSIDRDGKVEAQRFESDPNDTTRAYLSHTSIGLNLVISIEWLVSPDYINRLKAALIKTNNMLYDVTNGQVFIEEVTLYDNGNNWESADIQIHASNMQWPEATPDGIEQPDGVHISLPPAFYTINRSEFVQKFYDANPIDPSFSVFVNSLVHELGHYALGLYDEYQNRFGTRIHTDVNFGFMDSPDQTSDPMSTEMSDHGPEDAVFTKYIQTEQYYEAGSSCWEALQVKFFRSFENVDFMMTAPRNLGISSNAVIKGPNSDLDNPDFCVGCMMAFDIQATTTTNPMRYYQLVDPVTHRPRIAMVNLEKGDTKRWIIHGKTTQTGHIKLFNAVANDKILAASRVTDNWKFVETLVGTTSLKGGSDVEIIELKTVSGRFTLLSGIRFNEAGDPLFHCLPEQVFLSPPAIRLVHDKTVSDEQMLTEQEGEYSTLLSHADLTDGIIYFTAPDSLGETFFIPQLAAVREVADMQDLYYFGDMQLELKIDQSETTAEKVGLLTSDFPAPLSGLPDAVIRVSEVISIQAYPEGSDLIADMLVRYSADSLEALGTGALTLYKWEDSWVPLETRVDLVYNTVSASLDGPGYYAAFLDLTQSRLISSDGGYSKSKPSTGLILHPSYPNPFHTGTTIRFELPVNTRITLEILDLQGRKIATLVDEAMTAGAHTATWDCRDDKGNPVPPGIYIGVLNCGTVKLHQKMVMIR